MRAVSTWFEEPDEGFALTVFRGRKAKHHDADVLTAAVLGPEPSAPVEDPRLSTTYDAGGWPIRAGLEFWLAAGGEAEDAQQFPRRAAGDFKAPTETAAGDLDPRAEPFRWHSRGDGAGMIGLLAMSRRGRSSATSAATSSPTGSAPVRGVLDAGLGNLARVGRQGDGDDRRPRRCGSNPLFDETGRMTEAAFTGYLRAAVGRSASEVSLDGFGERYFAHLEP